jgi:hypothetical protein
MSEWIDPRHAARVADYKRRQDATATTGWTDRPDAPYRIKMFVPVDPVRDADE